jgi:hypothetical protein
MQNNTGYGATGIDNLIGPQRDPNEPDDWWRPISKYGILGFRF